MTIITNDPAIDPINTDMSPLERRADTFVSWRSIYPEPTYVQNTSRSFVDEKLIFLSMLPLLYSRYPGEYVAVSGGEIVAHGSSRNEVTRKFFQRPNRGSVYIGFVGPQRTIRQASPFRSRPNASLP
jgi:hypothetical protein